MLRTDRLDYHLPPERIATRAVDPRDAARMLVVSRSDPNLLEHRIVRDLPNYLTSQDALVFNETHVLRARIQGVRLDTGGRVEGLFLQKGDQPSTWRMLLRSNGKLRPGVVVRLHDATGAETPQSLRLVEKQDDAWIVEPSPVAPDPSAALERIGSTPLPPYILHARKSAGQVIADDHDRGRYQTIFATTARGSEGSVAAPTAGLHFTHELLQTIQARGVQCLHVQLDVGAGTFKPVQSDFVEKHRMHAERCSVAPDVIQHLKNRNFRRLFAVGTTTARTLESIPEPLSQWTETGWGGETRLLVAPGYQWRFVDGMLTNFHLPRSTLLAMVAALFPEGIDRLLAVYEVAIRERYRFYSYGDAMLILP